MPMFWPCTGCGCFITDDVRALQCDRCTEADSGNTQIVFAFFQKCTMDWRIARKFVGCAQNVVERC